MMAEPKPLATRRFPHQKPLDGIRGIAALVVVMHHAFFGSLAWNLPMSPLMHYIGLTTAYGSYGVTLFFVLSGYLITSLLLLDRRRQYYFHNFYWKRVFRVLPPLVLVLLVTHFLGMTSWATVIFTLLFIVNFNELLHLPYSFSGPFWTLAIEEQFYVLWPAVVRFMKPRVMFVFMMAIVLATPFVRILSGALGHGRMHYTFMQCDGLAWGALLALMAYRLRIPYRAMNRQRLWRLTGLPMLIAGAILLALTAIESTRLESLLHLTLEGIQLLIVGLLTFILTRPKATLSRFLALRPMVFFGNISYMLYLVHTYVLSEFDEHLAAHFNRSVYFNRSADSYMFIRFFIVLAISMLICTASLYLFERPLNGLRRYMLKSGSRMRGRRLRLKNESLGETSGAGHA
jgi:peptidoglycan/LPS O-acetylase OafA/YrhL